MRGIISETPFRTGGFINPIVTNDSTNIILEFNAPSQSTILCTSCTIENESELLSNGDIIKTTEGYFIKNNIDGLKITRANTIPITIMRGREILYTGNIDKIANLYSSAYYSAAVAYNGQVHALLGGNSTVHYKTDGVNWYKASDLPYQVNSSNFTVFEGRIHLLGGNASSTPLTHYAWDGVSWKPVSTLPRSVNYNSAVFEYKNELHLIGPYLKTGATPKTCEHYKLVGNTWQLLSTVPFYIDLGCAFEYNGEIHVFGGNGTGKDHYVWDGSTWTKSVDLPTKFSRTYGNAVKYNGEIYVLGGQTSYKKLYKWDGTSWVTIADLPYTMVNSAVCVLNNKIQLFSGSSAAITNLYYEWDGVSWKNTREVSMFNLPQGCRINNGFVQTSGEFAAPRSDNYLIEY